MAEMHVYHGNCHCGAIKYTVKVPVIDTVNVCNCAYCFKKGYLWVALLGEDGKESLNFERGSWEEMRSYRFGTKTAEHKFCSSCGSGIMTTLQGHPNLRGINVCQPTFVRLYTNLIGQARTFQDLDVWSVKTVSLVFLQHFIASYSAVKKCFAHRPR